MSPSASSVANAAGGRVLRGLIYIALACELIASAGTGTAHGASWLVGPFLLARGVRGRDPDPSLNPY
jgi:hypothetical protein